MVVVRRPPDTFGEINALATSLGNAATVVGSFRQELASTGDRLYKGWYGAAERMVAREIQTLAGFLDDLYKSLSQAAAALKTYATALSTATSELDTEEKRAFVKDEKLVTDPYGSAFGSFVSPGIGNFDGLKITVENARILTVLKPIATAAHEKVMAAGPLIAKGSGTDLKSIIDYKLPFQRPFPLIPGVRNPKKPQAGMPANVNSKTWSPDVKLLQEILLARGWRIDVTGKFDDRTREVVRQFQDEKGIDPATGKVDAKTWDALWKRKITGW